MFLYLLLSLGEGDIWRNIGFVIWLYFDMLYGWFENFDSLDEVYLVMFVRILYCIEGYVFILQFMSYVDDGNSKVMIVFG